jgi:aspartate/methionine/tyrosine aminotransferase
MSWQPRINPFLRDTATPPIPEARGWGRAYSGALGPLIDLSQAVPADPPPPEMLGLLAEAAGSAEAARYGAIEGDMALREAYAAELAKVYRGPVSPSETVITTGCNQAFIVAALAVAGAGERIILPSPWYFNHRMALDMLGIGAVPLACRAEDGFIPDAGAAERLVDGSTRAIVLVTPNNPTGAIYPPELIAAFADLARRRGLWLILDETYRDLVPGDGPPHGLVADAGGWPEGVIQLYSFSKAFAIPGHRLGALVAPRGVQPEIAKVLDTLQISPPRVGQMALAKGLPALHPWRAAGRRAILARGETFRTVFRCVDGWRLHAVGAYFAFVSPPGEQGRAARIAGRAARERGVLMLPGTYFGDSSDSCMRVAFANAGEENLALLPERLAGLAD